MKAADLLGSVKKSHDGLFFDGGGLMSQDAQGSSFPPLLHSPRRMGKLRHESEYHNMVEKAEAGSESTSDDDSSRTLGHALIAFLCSMYKYYASQQQY